jgi:hypothetical protein
MKTRIAALILFAAASLAARAQTTSLSGSLTLTQNATYTKRDGSTYLRAAFPQPLMEWPFANGTNVSQVNAFYSEGPTTLTNSATKEISLLAATNAFGDVLTFSRVHWLAVKAGTNNVDDVWAFQNPGADAFNIANNEEFVPVAPGGVLFLFAPAVAGMDVAANRHMVSMGNSGTNTATYELYIGGVAE